MNKEIKRIIGNYAHDYEGIMLTYEEMEELLESFWKTTQISEAFENAVIDSGNNMKKIKRVQPAPTTRSLTLWSIKEKKVYNETLYDLKWEQDNISFLLDKKELLKLSDLINDIK